ncbi:MAG: ATP synthase F1 subunit gamma [Bacteroidota bacterium]
MATLREIRNRIVGVKKTQKITRAMKMVAAARLRRAQAAMFAARPYARKMAELLGSLAGSEALRQHPLVSPREVRSVAIVVVTSDRGLCGAFNSNLIKATLNLIATKYTDLNATGNLKLFCIGRKGFDVLSKRHYKVAGKHIGVYNNLVFGKAQAIAREIIGAYEAGEVDRVEVVYNEFKSVAQQKIVIEQFLPIPSVGPASVQSATDYIYEPSLEEIVRFLVPGHLHFQVWRMLLESNAAEIGSRMAAMENATENASEMISSLQLSYNKARQASITTELLEVVSGAEALRRAG